MCESDSHTDSLLMIDVITTSMIVYPLEELNLSWNMCEQRPGYNGRGEFKFAEKNFTDMKQEGSKLWEDYNIMIV